MANVEIFAGVCGFVTRVNARMEGDLCNLEIQSDCEAIQRLASELQQVNPYKEISARRAVPVTLQAGMKFCTHAACPVPVGIIKAVEVAAGLALPKDVVIKVSKE
jgi:hypothetical protein